MVCLSSVGAGRRQPAFSHTEEKRHFVVPAERSKYCCVCFYVCVLNASSILMQTDCKFVDLRRTEHKNP